MSYLTQARLADDETLRLRVTACAATERIPDPAYWAQSHAWEISASPDWDDAWASALAADVANPGADEGVISDGMILAAVQELRAAETAPPE